MESITISPVTSNDVHAISELQESLLLSKTKNPENGFLVSGFTEEEYTHFITNYEYFYKATLEGEIVGILMAFRSKSIPETDSTNQMLKYICKTEFILIKQVFTSIKHGRMGIAQRLYEQLFSDTDSKLPFIAVIVSEPINMASYKFHEKFNFSEYLQFEPKPDFDGKIRKRSAWIKLPNSDGQLSDFVRLTNSYTSSDRAEQLLNRSNQISSLYTHEDNLNWTKMGIQVTLLFAFIAAFGYFYERSLTKSAFPVLLPLALWGVIIHYVFFLKIRSGVKFMSAHKKRLIELDDKINFYYPKIPQTFAPFSTIQKKSRTLKLMPSVSFFGIIIWCLVAVLLILKAFGVFSI